MRHIQDREGLTLIEVLIAVAVLTVVLLSVYGTFFSVHGAVNSSDSYMTRLREVRLFFDLIRKEIESSYLNIEDSNTLFRLRDRDLFGLKASELAFTAFVPYGTGLYYVEYKLDEESKQLYKKVAGLWRTETEEKIEVLDNVDEFSIEVNNAKRWIGTYNTELTKKLPSAVRVTLKFRLNGEAIALEETILPKLGG